MLDEPAMGRGEEVTLDTRDSARRRVVCGLGWGLLADGDHAVERVSLAEGGKGSMRDLDLLCLMFDKFGGFIDGVTGEEGFRTGDNGNIYHTGDETGGEESTDDEEIVLELFNLSRKIHQIFFIAEVQSDHNFGDVGAPKIRFAYSSGARNVVVSHLGGEAGQDRNAYVFGGLRREGTGWVFKYIGDYFDGSTVSDWTVALRDYIDIADLDTGKGAYTGMRVPAKGQTVPLFYTKEARHRVMCAINWDPGVEEVSKLEKMKNREQNLISSDIDLACVMFSKDKEAVDGVSAKPDEAIDASGKVYHTGDDTTGEGDQLDDEAISVELRDLPDHIWHIVFLAEIQSRHTFKELRNPAMRFADGKTDTNQLTASLTADEGKDCGAYIFSRISRKGEGWSLTFIDDYLDGNKIEDWLEHLKRYLG